jgi:NAD-dependent SIR2 family protein deacetylase
MKMHLKCTQCGNTFPKETPNNGDIVSGPICGAQYVVVVKLGKIVLKEYVLEEGNLGQF